VVGVQSDRICKAAGQYRQQAVQQTNLERAVALAKGARGEAKARLADLRQQQAATQRAAIKDWDSRLAKLRSRAIRFRNASVVADDQPQPQPVVWQGPKPFQNGPNNAGEFVQGEKP
jgi:hypothetical protein